MYLLGCIAKAVGKRSDAIAYLQTALATDPFLWSAFEELCSLGVDAAPEAWVANPSFPLPQRSVSAASDDGTPFILKLGVAEAALPTPDPSPYTPVMRMQMYTSPGASVGQGAAVTPGAPPQVTPKPVTRPAIPPPLLSPATPTHTLTPIGNVKLGGPAVGGIPPAPMKTRGDGVPATSSKAVQPATVQKLFATAPAPALTPQQPITAAVDAVTPMPPPKVPITLPAASASAAPAAAPVTVDDGGLGNQEVLALLGMCGVVLQHIVACVLVCCRFSMRPRC